jgi:hypothetical protein
MDTIVCKHLRQPFYYIQLASSQIQRFVNCDKRMPLEHVEIWTNFDSCDIYTRRG